VRDQGNGGREKARTAGSIRKMLTERIAGVETGRRIIASPKTFRSFDLSDRQFREISDVVKSICGINLHQGKRELVKARLAKRLRLLGLSGYKEYLQYIENDASGEEFVAMLDALSTNLTGFFREADHFAHLTRDALPGLIERAQKRDRRVRMWSAGCSSGEEPYSMAVIVHESVPNLSEWDIRILATDLSTRMLARAKEAVYPKKRIETVPAMNRARYFTCIQNRPEKLYEVNDNLRSLVHIARLNLMDEWPMKGPFDVIFCRNVMIYFDKETQSELVEKFWRILAPGGYLYIGHSESLTGVKHRFRYVQPTVYQKT